MRKADLAEIFKSIREGYVAGRVYGKARRYFLEENKAITLHNTKGLRQKLGRLFLELITGYGVRPLRVLATMLAVFAIPSVLFMAKLGFSEGLLLSAGAFLTFGANTYHLSALCGLFKIVYVAESFCGILLMALFIIVLANLWFSEK